MGTLFHLSASLTRQDIPALCDDLAGLLRRGHGDVVICDVAGVTRPDVVTVEALARLRLTARRHGRRLEISGAGPELTGLLGLLGLSAVLPGGSLQVGREPEDREQPAGVQEVVDSRDPPV